MRVLYVDDDRINALLFAEACRAIGGLEVDTAASGVEALDLAAGWLPELLVIDLHLPDTNGFDLLPALRRRVPALTEVPAFLCTADDGASVATGALKAGFLGCWPKPAGLQFMHGALAALGHSRPMS